MVLKLLATQCGWNSAPKGSHKRCLHAYLAWLDFMASMVPVHSFKAWMASAFVITCTLSSISSFSKFPPSAMHVVDVDRVLKGIAHRWSFWPGSPVCINGSDLAAQICGTHQRDLDVSVERTLNNMCFVSGMAH